MSRSLFKQRRLWEKTVIGAFAVFLPLLLFETIGFLKASELQFLDVMTKLRGVRPPSSNVILITEDDATVNALGSPLPRHYYTQLLRALRQYGVKTILLDVQFRDQKDPATDTELAAAMQNHGHVIQPFVFNYRWDEDPGPGGHALTLHDSLFAPFAVHPRHAANLSFIWADSVMLPHALFIKPAAKAGVVFTFPDDDGRYRQLPLLCKNLGRIYPASSLLTIAEFLGVPLDSLQIRQSFWGERLTLPAPLAIPVNQHGQVLLNYYGPLTAFPSYSILQILESLQDIENRRAPRVPLRDFTGKIVVIGVNATLEKDFFVTPFAEDFPGMGLHATAVSNMLNGDSLRQWPWYIDAGLALIFTLVLYGGLLLIGKPNTARKTVYAVLVFAAIFLLFMGFAYQILFKMLNIVPAILQTSSALLLGFAAMMFYEKSWHEKTLKQEVGRLQAEITSTLAQIDILSATINARDNEHKNITYLLEEFEKLVDHSAEVFKNPLDKMRILKGKIEEELNGLRQTRQRLEDENKSLKKQMQVRQENAAATTTAPSPVVVAPPAAPQVTLEEVNWVIEQYKKFVDKAQVTHYFNPAFNMITAVMNGRPHGEPKKSKMQDIFALIERISAYDSTVLITGAIGAGKTELAKAIHYHSRRKQGPFQCVNIAGIPENLIESQLFGHKKGAFTGALYDLKGAFECANGGTIVLDEIGDLKPELQVKLLHVLQDKKFNRVGSNEQIEVDIRIIAATNRDLPELIQEKKFREDLFSRLNVISIQMPSLNERREEIPHFVHYFLANLNKKYDKQKRISDDALTAMILHHWRSNIRELQNIVHRAYVNSPDNIIRPGDLDEDIRENYRQIFNEEYAKIWNDLVKATQEEMESLCRECQAILRANNIEHGQLRLGDAFYKNCFDYMRAYLDNKGSSFPPDQRETLARQMIVALSERLADWCRSQKIHSMEICWKEIEKLLGRTRRMIAIWKDEVGLPPFAATS